MTDQTVGSPYKDVRFMGYILARGLSMVGDNIWWIAVGWAAAQLGDPALTGIVLACAGVPRVALMLLGGAVSDLRGARPIMLASNVGGGVAALIAAGIATQQEQTALWLLIGMAVVFGTIDSFYIPAANSFMATLLSHRQLPRGAAIRNFTNGLANAGGRSLGGLLVAAGGFALGAAMNGVSFLLCFAILLFVRPRRELPRPDPETGVRQALTDGLHYVAGQKVIRGLALITLVLNAVAVPVETVSIVLRAQEAGWGAPGYGLVAGSLGGGMIAGTFLGTILKPPKHAGRWLAFWLALGCPALAVLATGTVLPVACVAAGVWSLCLGPTNAILSAVLFTTTKPEVLGRVQSVVSMLAHAVTPVANAGFGLLVGVFGLTEVGIFCVVTFAATVAWMLISRDIRGATIPTDDDADTTTKTEDSQ